MEQGLLKFTKQLKTHNKVAIDTPCLIYYIERNSKYIKLTETIFEDFLAKGRIEIIASTLLLAEILVRPFAQNKPGLVLDYKSIISKNFTLCPLSTRIAETAAKLRAKYHIGIPDTIHLATAIEEGASVIVGNDRGWKQVKEIKTIILEDFIPSEKPHPSG